jgi:aryl-alcohol dehydrogenase-like predicted oxidoreductase
MAHLNRPVLSRRRVVQAGLLVGLGSALPAAAVQAANAAASGTARLLTKPIPSTGEQLPVIGIGTTQFGGTDAAAVRAILARMYELGGTLIDTARAYKGSETHIGRALRESNLRSKMFLATKFNARGVVGGESPDIDSSAEQTGLQTFERSLQELQTDKVDLLMAHWLGSVDTLMPVMLDLKKAGRVRYIGITNFLPALQPQLAQFMRKYPLDFVQTDYRLNDRSAEKEIFPLALERKVAIVASVPFGGRSDLLFRQIGERKLPDWAAEFDAATWGQFFLKYVVSHPAVTCAIPGSNDIAHVEDNMAAGRGRMPDAAMRKRMEAFWEGKA